eukprot:8851921-Pyramimonas_sp.AAC.1
MRQWCGEGIVRFATPWGDICSCILSARQPSLKPSFRACWPSWFVLESARNVMPSTSWRLEDTRADGRLARS